MQLLVTPAIEDTLSKLLETKLPSETEKALHQCLTQKTIPLCVAKQLSEMTGTLLQDLLKGSKIVPPIPPEKPNTLVQNLISQPHLCRIPNGLHGRRN